MSVSARSIAALGIGFGALAVAEIGFVAEAPAVTPRGGNSSRVILKIPDRRLEIIGLRETEDEEAVVMFVLLELIKTGYIA